MNAPGAAALAGTPHPIDRHQTAQLLALIGRWPMPWMRYQHAILQWNMAAAAIVRPSIPPAEEMLSGQPTDLALSAIGCFYHRLFHHAQKRNPDAAERTGSLAV